MVSSEGLNNEYTIEDDALNLLANFAGGDLRFALNKLEIAAFTTSENKIISKEIIENVVKKANSTIDKNEDGHYDAVSALKNSGYIKGNDDNTFAPERFLSRAEAAQVLKNFTEQF